MFGLLFLVLAALTKEGVGIFFPATCAWQLGTFGFLDSNRVAFYTKPDECHHSKNCGGNNADQVCVCIQVPENWDGGGWAWKKCLNSLG